MPTNKSRAEYMRERRAKAKELERAAASKPPVVEMSAKPTKTRKEMVALCNCEPPSEEFPAGIKCWEHLYPLIDQKTKDLILAKINEG